MTTHFDVHTTDGAARTGTLSTPHGNIATPALLLYTRRGGVLNLTGDLLESLRPEPKALQIDATHL
jgi:queuine/archaeosine tRNA-ribosyltransferase